MLGWLVIGLSIQIGMLLAVSSPPRIIPERCLFDPQKRDFDRE